MIALLVSFSMVSCVLSKSDGKCSVTDTDVGCAPQASIRASLLQRDLTAALSHLAVEEEKAEEEGETTMSDALALVVKLANASGGHSWNMTDTEKLALDTIRQMVRQLFNTSQIQHASDQAEVDFVRDDVQNCTNDSAHGGSDLADKLITAGIMRAEANRTRGLHAQCRIAQNQKVNDTHTSCLAYDTHRKDESLSTPPACMATGLVFNKISSDDSTVKAQMESCLTSTVQLLQPLYDKYKTCRDNKNNKSNLATDCSTKQGDFENDFLDYADFLNDTCTEYSTCRSNKIAWRNTLHGNVQRSEAARKADWQTGHRLLCLMRVFDADNDNKTSTLQACMNLTVDVSNITINYHGIPAAGVCIREADQPCDTSWLNREYTTQTWYNASLINTCKDTRVAPAPPPPPVPLPGTVPCAGGLHGSRAQIAYTSANQLTDTTIIDESFADAGAVSYDGQVFLLTDNSRHSKGVPAKVFVSTDGGATFQVAGLPTGLESSTKGTNWYRPCAMSSTGTNMVVADFGRDGMGSPGGNVYISTDTGQTWVMQSSLPQTKKWRAVGMSADGQVVYACGQGSGGWITTNSGGTWTASSPSQTTRWDDMAMSSDGQTIAVVGFGGEFYMSTDGGVSWGTNLKSILNPPSGSIGGGRTAMSADGKIVMVAFHASCEFLLWVSWDGGATFQRVSNCVSQGIVYRITMSNDGTKVVVLAYQCAPVNAYTMFYSGDYGVTWAQAQQPPTNGEDPSHTLVLSGDGTKFLASSYNHKAASKFKLYLADVTW